MDENMWSQDCSRIDEMLIYSTYLVSGNIRNRWGDNSPYASNLKWWRGFLIHD